MTQITVPIKNFTKEELTCRCGCGRYNYDTEFLIRLQAFRYMLNIGLTVTGPGRCKKHNASPAVGGAANSLHICEGKAATAADVTNSNCENIYKKACASGLFNEVIWYKKKNFVHLGLDRNQKGNFFQIKP